MSSFVVIVKLTANKTPTLSAHISPTPTGAPNWTLLASLFTMSKSVEKLEQKKNIYSESQGEVIAVISIPTLFMMSAFGVRTDINHLSGNSPLIAISGHEAKGTKTELWDRWQRGESLRAIGRAFGKRSSSKYFQLAPHGGIRPEPRRRSRLALILSEREEISRGIVAQQSIRSMARLLGRSPSTVSREQLDPS